MIYDNTITGLWLTKYHASTLREDQGSNFKYPNHLLYETCSCACHIQCYVFLQHTIWDDGFLVEARVLVNPNFCVYCRRSFSKHLRDRILKLDEIYETSIMTISSLLIDSSKAFNYFINERQNGINLYWQIDSQKKGKKCKVTQYYMKISTCESRNPT